MQKPIYIISNNTYVRKRGNSLVIDRKGKKVPCPSENISYLVKQGTSQISEQVLNFLSDKGVPIFRFSYGGKYQGAFIPPEHNIGKIRLKQYEAYFDEKKRLFIAKSFVESAVKNKIAVLRRYYYKTKNPELKIIIGKIKSRNIISVDNIESLRGFEGTVAKDYFSGLKLCLKHFEFSGREYHPPKGEINCLLSFQYSLLYCEINSKLSEHGLSLFLGYLHEQNNNQFPLTYDLSEMFKQEMDLLVLSLVNTGQIKDEYFNKKETCCLLNTYGKKFILKEWQKFLMKTTFNEFDERVSYGEKIRKEVLKLKRFLEEGGSYEGYLI